MPLTAITSSNALKSGFFRKLPLELREEIYAYILIRRRTKFRYVKVEWDEDKRNTYFRNMISLLLVSQQVYNEAMSVFLEENHIVIYHCFAPPQPEMLELDTAWFAKSPLPIRTLTLNGQHTQAIVASCPKLMYLTMDMEHHVTSLEKAEKDDYRDAWVTQYKNNLAKLLSRRGSRLRLRAPGTFLEIFEIHGRGEDVGSEEVVALISKIQRRCRIAAAWIEKSAVLLPVEHAVEGWVVSIGHPMGDVMTAVLVRRAGDDDWALCGEVGDEVVTDMDLWNIVAGTDAFEYSGIEETEDVNEEIDEENGDEVADEWGAEEEVEGEREAASTGTILDEDATSNGAPS